MHVSAARVANSANATDQIPDNQEKQIHIGDAMSIHTMTLQPKLGLGLLYWSSVTIMFYGVRLLASRPTPVNFEGPMIFCWGLLP
jgi:hypothetical protein